ncbi:MAG: hypothetical protein GX783_00345 [Clostridiales bacterium]|nr:hypothetical protein [Clostridiales bacterium]
MPNGEVFWPDKEGFQAYGGVDNAFEGFHSWPLFYLMGGDKKFLALAQRQFDVITEQFSRYKRKSSDFEDGSGRETMLVKEYLPDMDWMHQGESALYFYFLNLADPGNKKNKERSIRFASFFNNEDEDIPEYNYDYENKVFKTAHIGSNGPMFSQYDKPYKHGTWMDFYGLAFYNVPGVETMMDLKNPEKAKRYGEVYSARLKNCDTVTNLLSTSMMVNAYMHTGDEKYKQWVLDYVGGWRDRYKANDGMMPDNAGPNGIVGETIDGKWYGGHYGWTFPHGFYFIGDAMVIGGENERLLTGEKNKLTWVREQVKLLMSKSIEDDNGTILVPQKYADPDSLIEYKGSKAEHMTSTNTVSGYEGFTKKIQIDGWYEFTPLNPVHMAHVYLDSFDDHDMGILRETRDKNNNTWECVSDSAVSAKFLGGQNHAYTNFLDGHYDDYPVDALKHSINQVYKQLKKLHGELHSSDTPWGYPPGSEKQWQELREVTQQVNAKKKNKWSESVTHSYFQTYLIYRSTITTEALIHLTMGGLMPIYNGGLLLVSVRYFDPEENRPGLPDDVAALVSYVKEDEIGLEMINLHPSKPRRVIVQAGAFGEHDFTKISYRSGDEHGVISVNDRWFQIELGAGCGINFEIGLSRYTNQPSYIEPIDRV